MMTDYILAAEADKIQDLIFRSAHLREVVGGSQLLSDFCKKMPKKLGVAKEDIIINDGGSFTLQFRGEEEARTFGKKLAETYRLAAGGSLTVADPEPVNGSIGAASKEAQKKLRSAKRNRKGQRKTTAQIPYASFCASCGVSLGVKHNKLHEKDAQAQYFCASCLKKSQEWKDRRLGNFLQPFYALLKLNRQVRAEDIPVAEDVAKLDPRGYVAYLLADGNSMGDVFDQCNSREKLEKLSEKLTEVTRKSLAVPTNLLIRYPEVERRMRNKMSVLPLIVGGDDFFALIPAPWALDFARRFANEYEKLLNAVFRELPLHVNPPTLGVVVVICKAKYPYYLAYDRGYKLLDNAKQLGKAVSGMPRSTVNFDVILGNRLAVEEGEGKYRPTLRPYWAGDEDVDDWGLSIQHLLNQRHQLKNVPHRRLAQLRIMFDEMTYQDSGQREKSLQRIEKLIQRIAKISDYKDTAADALEILGGRNELYQVKRAADKDRWEGHALPDLLEMWDFSYQLDKSPSDYEGDRQ